MHRKLKTLSLIPLLLVTAACGIVDTVITVLEKAPVAIARLPVSEAEKTRLTRGATRSRQSFITYRETDRSTKEKKRAAKFQLATDIAQIASEDFAPVSNATVQEWINHILFIIRRAVGLPQTFPIDQPLPLPAGDTGDLQIKDADVKELKKSLENPPQ